MMLLRRSIVVVLFLLLSGCARSALHDAEPPVVAVEAAPAKPPRDAAPSPPPPTIAVVYEDVRRDHPHAELKARIPRFESGSPALDASLDALHDRLRADVMRVLEQAGDMATEDQGSPMGMPHSLDVECTALRVTSRWISVFCSHYSYSGGAHPNLDLRTVNAVVVAGAIVRPVSIEEIVVDAGARRALGLHVGRALLERGATLLAEAAEPLVEIAQLRAFEVTEHGVNFVFPPYAVGSYAEGTYEVSVSWQELEPWIDDELRRAMIAP